MIIETTMQGRKFVMQKRQKSSTFKETEEGEVISVMSAKERKTKHKMKTPKEQKEMNPMPLNKEQNQNLRDDVNRNVKKCCNSKEEQRETSC